MIAPPIEPMLAAQSRWKDCCYDPLEITTPYELSKVFGVARGSALD